MATKKTTEPAAVNVNEVGLSKKVESQFTIDELTEARENLFGRGTSIELVQTALGLKHKTMFTKSEAKKAIEDFKKREVR